MVFTEDFHFMCMCRCASWKSQKWQFQFNFNSNNRNEFAVTLSNHVVRMNSFYKKRKPFCSSPLPFFLLLAFYVKLKKKKEFISNCGDRSQKRKTAFLSLVKISLEIKKEIEIEKNSRCLAFSNFLPQFHMYVLVINLKIG